jgi:acyl-CoA reductase-like NAD-dependent aldehyde dehydrogenase
VGAGGTDRARLLRRRAELIPDDAERIAIVETTESRKLIREMERSAAGTG